MAQAGRQKRASKGDLTAADIAVATHSFIGSIAASRSVVISTTPASVSLAIEYGIPLQETPILFTTSSLSLAELKTFSVFNLTDDTVVFRLDKDGPRRTEIDMVESGLLQTLMCVEEPVPIGDTIGGPADDAEAILLRWEREGLVSQSCNTIGETCWILTAEGRRLVKTGSVASGAKQVLKQFGDDIMEMSKFGLIMTLESRGWLARIAENSKQTKHARSNPYKHGGAKEWWFKRDGGLSGVNANYLRALLRAGGSTEVPHFSRGSDYQKLLNPEWKPPVRKRKRVAFASVQEGDDFWGFDEAEAIAKRAKPRRRVARGAAAAKPKDESAAARPVVESQDSTSESEPKSLSDDVASASASSTSSSASPRASAAGSESASESEAGKSPSAAPAEPPIPVAGRARAQRSVRTGIPYGACWRTPRWDVSGNVSGYQILCTAPGHSTDGKCTKEISNKRAGGDHIARRILKSWCYFGCASEDRQAHRDSFDLILALSSGGSLPTEEVLDLEPPLDWAEYQNFMQIDISNETDLPPPLPPPEAGGVGR